MIAMGVMRLRGGLRSGDTRPGKASESPPKIALDCGQLRWIALDCAYFFFVVPTTQPWGRT